MQTQHEILRRALVLPTSLMSLSPVEWDDLIRQARRANLLARLEILISERGLRKRIPTAVKPHLDSSRLVAENEARLLRWEVNRIWRALGGVDTPVILLKGAAYTMANLPNSRGRLCSDVDILVPKSNIAVVEKTLLEQGWEHVKLEDYDQYYYRQWSHELPPLRHRVRGTVIDVHHTILPPTNRLRPDAEKLWQSAQSLDGTGFKILAPADLLLHCVAHVFQDGDLNQAFRDLVDLDDLIRHFSGHRGFWEDLVRRAAELDLKRPLYYALRYTRRHFGTPIPNGVITAMQTWRPFLPIRIIMDLLVNTSLTAAAERASFVVSLTRRLLFIRSHWLRMPPWLLAKHLVRKSWMRWTRSKMIGVQAVELR